MVLKAGEMLGPYEIVGTLGQGGMAIVYKGHHPKLDRYVAIKILHHVYLQDPTYVTRFEREAQIVARLEHPHIVPVYDFAEFNGQPYLVMKFIEGRTLKSIIGDAPLSQSEIVRIMSLLAGALDYAHVQGVLHRDLKPSNILIDRLGVPYLSDFGLARIAEAGESTISKDMLLGTPQYIAPEQAQAGKNVDARTDLYSFGIVLYELLVGRVPFSADTSYAILHDQIYTPLPPPNEVNPTISADVAAVLVKALAKEPNHRYASAVNMMAALSTSLNLPQSATHSGHPAEPTPIYESVSPRIPVGVAALPLTPSFARTPPLAPPTAVPNFTFDAAKPRSVAQPVKPTATKRPMSGRRWFIGGLITLVILAVLIAVNLAGALHDADQLNVAPRVTKTAATPVAPTQTVAPTVAPTTAPTLQPTVAAFALLTVPNLSATQAQVNAAAYPKDPAVRIAIARSQWNAGQLDDARTTLDDGAKLVTDLGGNVAAYYLSAAAAAQQDHAPLAAAYADIRALNTIDTNNIDYATVRNLAGSDLYLMTGTQGMLTAADVRRIADQAGGTTPLIDTMAIQALVTETRYSLAQTAIERLLTQNSTLAEAHLVQGNLYAAKGNASRAKDEWKTARQAADAPVWVVQQATDSITSST